ncbi:hypothetical protein BD413DRAFT_494975 [Trametes elegans]|nr:hypothetical protein BD413DRAFT_494975 [Trametes elegans]
MDFPFHWYMGSQSSDAHSLLRPNGPANHGEGSYGHGYPQHRAQENESRAAGLPDPFLAPYEDVMRSQANAFSLREYSSTHAPFSYPSGTHHTNVNRSAPVGLPPQAFQLSPQTTLVSSLSAGNISSPQRAVSEGPMEEETEAASAPPTMPPAEKENNSIASISPGKAETHETANGPESVAGPSRSRGAAPTRRSERIRVRRGDVNASVTTARPITSSSVVVLPKPAAPPCAPGARTAGPARRAPARRGPKVKGTSGRVRRTNDQLEQRVAPAHQRCGILWCEEDLRATTKLANKHIRAHYDHAAALSAGQAARSESTTSCAAGSSTSTSGQAWSDAGSDEEAEKGAAPKAPRWQGPFPCWFQESAMSRKCCEITGEEYADVCGLQRHCRKTHHQWYFVCTTCQEQFERRDEYRAHLALTQCG